MKLGARCGAAAAAKGQQHDPWLIARLGTQAAANGQHVVVQAVQGCVGLLTNVADASMVHGLGNFLIHHGSFHVEVAWMTRQLHTRMRRHLERSCFRLEEAAHARAWIEFERGAPARTGAKVGAFERLRRDRGLA